MTITTPPIHSVGLISPESSQQRVARCDKQCYNVVTVDAPQTDGGSGDVFPGSLVVSGEK